MNPTQRLSVAGAGMAGLVAAARARALGAAATVFEKGTRAGGSMLLSSGVVWRFRTLDEFRAECPAGDERLQRVVIDRLDDALDWLESLGAPVVARETGNPRTVGRRFDPRGLTEALLRAAGDVRLETSFPGDAEPPLVLATGGFSVRYARERGLLVRSNPWSEGDGLDYARAHGAALSDGMEEFYGRNMPAPPARFGEDEFVELAQLYGRYARVVNERGDEFFRQAPSWSENDLVQTTARQPGATAWYLVPRAKLGEPTPYGTIAEAIERVRAIGGTVEERGDDVAVHVMAAVTHTIGGLRINELAQVVDEDGEPIARLYAAGADAGGISTGGYASGLAAALVFGLVAADTAAADS